MARKWLRLMGCALLVAGGCGPVVKVDIDCKQLCLAAPGPTIPGSSSTLAYSIDGATPDWGNGVWDGGLDGYLDGAVASNLPENLPSVRDLVWVAEMEFNQVLAQLPSAAVSLSADVRLTSVTLTSTTALDFIESVDVVMSHGTANTEGDAPSSSGTSAASVDSGGGLSCKEAGSVLRVAYFRRNGDVAAGSTIDLVIVEPDLNVFDCIKDEPASFEVTLTPHLGLAPATDAPLSFGTCIGAETHTTFP